MGNNTVLCALGVRYKFGYRVESRGSGAENKPVTARTFIDFRGPKALLDN